MMSLSHPLAPAERMTVFAGQDVEATLRARSYFGGNPPSSPQVAILEDGKLRFLLQRHEIEGRTSAEVAARLRAAYDGLSSARESAG